MKNKFSKAWKSSKQPRKQRKYVANAPLHVKRKLLSVNLSKPLRKKHEKRNLVVRKGDVVKILRGKFKKKQGKVLRIDLQRLKIIIEGITIKKIDGSKVEVPMRPSNLQIQELNLEDKKRRKQMQQEIKTSSTEKKESTKINKTEKENAPKEK